MIASSNNECNNNNKIKIMMNKHNIKTMKKALELNNMEVHHIVEDIKATTEVLDTLTKTINIIMIIHKRVVEVEVVVKNTIIMVEDMEVPLDIQIIMEVVVVEEQEVVVVEEGKVAEENLKEKENVEDLIKTLNNNN